MKPKTSRNRRNCRNCEYKNRRFRCKAGYTTCRPVKCRGYL